MNHLKGKKILLAVCGSIAAYKTPHLVRLLIKEGAEVKVILTQAAATLVSPLALSTVSKNPIVQSLSDGANWNNHVELGYWADVMLFAPLSANTLAHLANGLCNNILDAVYLSAKCPIVFASAMDADMWEHEAVQNNITVLKNRKNHHYIPVEHGELASGLIGKGRMAEPETILSMLNDFFGQKQFSSIHKKALVTAGPTYEKIDPVRFIGNYSSGKMGIAFAKALRNRGYEVDLIIGPGVQFQAESGINVHPIESAEDMRQAVLSKFDRADITIMAAAVADFRPESTADQKIKKGNESVFNLNLVKNPDILKEIGLLKREGQIVLGFALETNNELENGLLKLKNKNADYIALNSMQQEESVFGSDKNSILLLCKDGTQKEFPSASKQSIAENIVTFIVQNSTIHEQ